MRVSLAVSKQYFSVEGASGVCVGLHASLCCLPFRIDLILAPGALLTPKHKKNQKPPFSFPSNQSPRYPTSSSSSSSSSSCFSSFSCRSLLSSSSVVPNRFGVRWTTPIEQIQDTRGMMMKNDTNTLFEGQLRNTFLHISRIAKLTQFLTHFALTRNVGWEPLLHTVKKCFES